MGEPSRDKDGRVLPYDDSFLPGDSLVLRYVFKDNLLFDQDGRRRLSKSVFSAASKRKDPHQGMSVDLAFLLEKEQLSLDLNLNEKHEGIVGVRIQGLRDLGFKVGRDPIFQPNPNPYHGNVWGIKSNHRKYILKICEWVIQPDNSYIPKES